MEGFLFNIKRAAFCAMDSFGLFVTGGTECVCCSEKAGSVPVCKNCRSKRFIVPNLDERRCSVCGKALISEKDLCMECRSQSVLCELNGVFPIFSYRLWHTEALCRWKMQGERSFSGFFASLMNERLSQIKKIKGDFVLVPVPPRPGKIKKTGWDQIEELCSILEHKYGWTVRRVLKRLYGVQQKSLDRKDRFAFSEKSYALLKDACIDFRAACIVDDVLTTGATIKICASVLKKGGCATVFGATLFTVDR